ncbi:MAG: acetate kinase [Rhizobiaceae bacterium MnEN-MB40S]|nr:MAG: acetate kinase [Rhizobiaceae bacterium MnEN-MB40S]
MEAILVINAGSSSLKFQLFGIDTGKLDRQIKGQIDGVGSQPRLKATGRKGEILHDRKYSGQEMPDLQAAIVELTRYLRSLPDIELRAIGHRVVHGGPLLSKPVLVDRGVLERLSTFRELAPLHQPHNLAPIRMLLDRTETLPQVACFDTAFHRGRPPQTDCYALPYHFYQQGVKRYGFHGLSYEYIADRLRTDFPDLANGRVIVAHLGSGASMCAIRDGQSIESTMGFTALDGLPMGTRPGQLDAGVVLYLIKELGMSPDEVSDLLYRKSGLKGISGISNDMRDLLESGEPRAGLAIDHFVHRCALHAGMLIAALGGLDGFVFTAGIGENSAEIRRRIFARLEWMGARLDHGANESAQCLISASDSEVAIHIIPTDEELMIARHTLQLMDEIGGVARHVATQ